MVKYVNIIDCKITDQPQPQLTVDGYTKRSGSPTEYMVRLPWQTKWRRVYVLCFSNASSLIVKIGGETFFIENDEDIRPMAENKKRLSIGYAYTSTNKHPVEPETVIVGETEQAAALFIARVGDYPTANPFGGFQPTNVFKLKNRYYWQTVGA